MEELTGPNLQIVLGVKEGKGFEQILQPTTIVASLNAHSLETDVVEPSSNPQYATDLIWEVDKSILRKMRSGQTPLKVECFIVKDNASREKVGYLILSIRSAQIIPKSLEDNAKANWCKLLGLKADFKTNKPELLLTLTIEDRRNATSNVYTESKDSDAFKQNTLHCTELTPLLLSDEHLIQLGPLDVCRDLFLLNITAISAANLDLILPEKFNLDVTANVNLVCRVLQNDVYFKPFKTDSEHIWMINEKIVVRIRSSFKVLQEYLECKPCLVIYLIYKNNIIGQSKLDLRPLIVTSDIQESFPFMENNSTMLNERCFLNSHNKIEYNPMHCRKSYVDLQLQLQHVGSKTDIEIQQANVLTTASSNNTYFMTTKEHGSEQNHDEIDSHRNPGGDFGKHVSQPMNYANAFRQENKYPTNSRIFKNHPVTVIPSHTADTVFCQCNKQNCLKNVEAYHYYCLNMLLNAIKLKSSKIPMQNIEFRFFHPKNGTIPVTYPRITISTDERTQLQNVDCKLYFISTADEIKHLVVSHPPKISIHNADQHDKSCISQCVPNMKQLFLQNVCQCQCEIPLYDMEENKIGDLDVTLFLEDHGPYNKIKKKSYDDDLGPPILDDNLAYKIVDELETWKERQKEIFKSELKIKEDRHLNLLSDEWQKHRESLESKLACSVEQCKMLANSLNNATEDLRTRRLKSFEKETKLIKANEDLQWKYEAKIQELKDSYRVMKEDLTSKIKILEEKNANLEAQIGPLSRENETLKLTVNKQSEELEIYQKGSLTQDQTATLLQELKALEEKLHSAQNSKSFFKEQWARAVREIHRMKMEHQQAIELHIKNSKEELQNINLEEILSADSNALTNDKILLNQIQREIDVIKPKPELMQTDSYGQVFAPTTAVSSRISHDSNKVLSKSGEYDDRLQALIEERDSLLKTGSYTIDDTVILRLNTEIRSLMIK